jgi:hypothetical protein
MALPLPITPFLTHLAHWLAGEPGIEAALLVGSYARGAARPDSDVDLVFICQAPRRYLDHAEWLSQFGDVAQLTDEDWGALHSRRVFYAGGLEVEFGITSPAWAATDPVDPGTRRVVSDGAQILLDKTGILAALLNVIRTS